MIDTPVKQSGRVVRSFYEQNSFPGYEDFDTPNELVQKAQKGVYAKLLDDHIPPGVRVLDAGCGTGQLVLYLSTMNRTVVGIDFSHASLRKGMDFGRRFGWRRAHFAQMDLFNPALQPESFDYVFSNGVLHHTADAAGGFASLCRLVKPGGYVTVGLYNTYGRLFLDLRRVVFRMTRNRFLWLDAFLRKRDMGAEKRRLWFLDQYEHPLETKFTIGDVLRWFRENDIDFVNAIPKIRLGDRLTEGEDLFDKHEPGSSFEHVLRQLGWIFTKGREGGFFIMNGRKREPAGRADARVAASR